MKLIAGNLKNACSNAVHMLSGISDVLAIEPKVIRTKPSFD
jgi:hypothetical protein